MKTLKKLMPMMLLAVVMVAFVAASKKPVKVYMCGDGTMADRAHISITEERGWGQVFPTFLAENVVVMNYAQNDRSTKSYFVGGPWEYIKNHLKRKDIVIIQFGYNDIEQSNENNYTSLADYEINLTTMVKDAQKQKAEVILCTPIAQRAFSIHTGELVDKYGAYSTIVRRVAQVTDVPCIDLNTLTMDWLRSEGESASAQYFCPIDSTQQKSSLVGKIDDVYLNEVGAVKVANMVADEIVKQKIKCLAPYVVLDNNTVKYTTPTSTK